MAALLVLVTVMLLIRVVGLIVLLIVDPAPKDPPRRRPNPCLDPLPGVPPAVVDPEQILADRLRTGSIGPDEYRLAMAALADRDERINPLRVPPGPAR